MTVGSASSVDGSSPTSWWGRLRHWWRHLPLSERVQVWLTVVTIGLTVLTMVIATAISLFQIRVHDQDDLQNHQTQCTTALINLSAELTRRAYLVKMIGQSSTTDDQQRAQDSDVALTGDWNSEKVACENSDLLNSQISVTKYRVQAYAESVRAIGTPDSSATPAGISAAIGWVSFAVMEVEEVQLKSIWLLNDDWSYPNDSYVFRDGQP